MSSKNETPQTQLYQGDVLLVRINEMPGNVKKTGEGALTLALGETSGHAHVLTGEVSLFEGATGLRVVVVDAPASFDHVKAGQLTGEHASITVPVGIWQVVQQVQWTSETVILAYD